MSGLSVKGILTSFIKSICMSVEQQLKQEIAALEHELRRVRDSLERNPTHAMESQANQLKENIDLCKRQLNSPKSPENTDVR
ncbi:MAG: hypothetical protein AAF353_07310 [Pseudomonadota bacterium]